MVKQRESGPVTEETEVRCRDRCLREVERVSIVFLRRMRSLTEDGHAGIDVRATSNCTRDHHLRHANT